MNPAVQLTYSDPGRWPLLYLALGIRDAVRQALIEELELASVAYATASRLLEDQRAWVRGLRLKYSEGAHARAQLRKTRGNVMRATKRLQRAALAWDACLGSLWPSSAARMDGVVVDGPRDVTDR